MNISKITVAKMFGRFDYEFFFKENQDIFIFHGPNGYGKTAILRIINAFLTGKFSEISDIPVEFIQCQYRNGNVVNLTPSKKKKTHEKNVHRPFSLTLTAADGSTKDLNERMSVSEKDELIVRTFPFMRRVGPNLWANPGDSSRVFVSEELMEYIPSEVFGRAHQPSLQSGASNKSIFPVQKCRFIETKRLYVERADEPFSSDKRPLQSRVDVAAFKIAGRIQSALGEYGRRAQQLDSRFPHAVIEGYKAGNNTRLSIERRLKKLLKKAKDLNEAGVLDEQKMPVAPKVTDELPDDLLGVLQVYCDHTNEKLTILEGLYERIIAFQEIINSRLTFKKLSTNQTNGIVISDIDTKESIPLSGLSSGEQHELILFFELLFETHENSVVLIDEPEISLHVSWQADFLDDIKKATRISNSYIVLATHSPVVIGDKWDNAFDLTRGGHQ